ncbi:type I-E CRISPR-associated protein Cas5/CasD [Corynebacterium rhinophilum]|uniref:type I-E CRISPR-associated protein Cas5/CasD n=1 Tax=Corynebacterium rhinophilum TaxID=3050197 RepID=UPI00254F4C1F|nr:MULTISPECIES: type I-E CRISPR-associated protein Cas5/CasD [unclassified Corynebacterium]MDK8466986.1 type I-E CRISPR-associated protein Cas5/CasD [Corynebacterium sp. MSK130]MDK8687526.1 type I-E CRISPR-associated protein Cas5/CasD [Corynebacterium sp. MSK122]
MTASLLLLLKGPMQSWGTESRYATRATSSLPSKSGVLGMLAAAEGRRRDEDMADLAGLKFAVRVDQSGSLLRDYQTAQNWQKDPQASAKLITRYFLSDAAFVAAIESEDREQLENFAENLNRPVFPLYLGRRSCPAPPNVVLGVVEKPAVTALQEHDTWHATKEYMKSSGGEVPLPIYRDSLPGESGVACQDVPKSFDPQHRKYSWRTVVQKEFANVENPLDSDERRPDSFLEAVMNV